ncbi:HEAT repeat domain-containing protein [archaeon]|nr:HEAT repeat domain-containing protein [archaeon]
MTLPKEFTDREIMRYARDESPRIRLRALLEAGERGGPKFLDLFGQALDDPQLNVRTKACWSLGRIESPKAAALLRKAFLQDPSWYVRGYAYRALAGSGPVSRTVKISR